MLSFKSLFAVTLLVTSCLVSAQFGPRFGWGGFGGQPHPIKPPTAGRRTCTILPLGSGADDVPQIAATFSPSQCGTNGHVIFPAGEKYNIASFLHITLDNVIIDWQGEWVFSTDLDYWRNNSFPIAFQNHHAGFIVSGREIHVDGGGVGGINGNGEYVFADLSCIGKAAREIRLILNSVWYTAEAGNTLPGRPMPFVWWNASDVSYNLLITSSSIKALLSSLARVHQ